MTLFAFSIPLALYQIHDYVVPLIIFGALYGFRWKLGMWSNLLTLGAVLFSFLIAIGWWESLAYFLAQQVPQLVYLADCIAFWTIFLVALSILDLITRYMSSIKVKYADVVENAGNGAALFLLATSLCITYSFAYHDLGPVGENHDVELKEGAKNPLTFQALRLLSIGNLSGFTQTNIFDGDHDTGKSLRERHLKRRQALMLNMIEEAESGPVRGILGGESLNPDIKWRE